MRDEEKRQPELRLQILEQIDNLRLDRDIERGDRFVRHDEFRIDGERACDTDALPLAAGELVRIAVRVIGLQADESQQLLNSALRFLAARDVVNAQRFAHDVADGHPRIERGVGVLEDDLHLFAQLAHVFATEQLHVAAFEDTSPLVAGKSRSTTRPAVVFPEPDSPTSPSVSPRRIEKSMPSTAFTSPTCFENTPVLIGKYL